MINTALLLMDLQNGIISRVESSPSYLGKVQQVMAAARNAGILIIHVVVKFRAEYPEISLHNKSFAPLKAGIFPMNEGNALADIHESFTPRPEDIIVTKRRVGAFSGSDLEIVLKSQEINNIVLSGIATSGVVLSTVRAAADKDYKITVLSDCCYDKDEEVHKLLTEKIFPSQAEVVTAKQWLQAIKNPVSV